MSDKQVLTDFKKLSYDDDSEDYWKVYESDEESVLTNTTICTCCTLKEKNNNCENL